MNLKFLCFFLGVLTLCNADIPKNPMGQTDYGEYIQADIRDFIWHDSFLKLMLHDRLHLQKAKKVLDVGCGTGHWTQKFAPYLHKQAEIHGVDLHQKWVDASQERFASQKTDQTFYFKQGSAYQLPYPDNTFDFVTCQTLLMHLEKPELAIKEMLRVLRKGGAILLVEGNSHSDVIRSNSAQKTLSLQEEMDYWNFYLCVEKGKEILKEGSRNVSSFIPQHLTDLGFTHVEIYRSDKCFLATTLGESQAQQALLSRIVTLVEKDYFYFTSKQDTERFFRATDASPHIMKKGWAASKKVNDAYIKQIKEGTFHGTFGGELVLSSAIKP